MQMKIVSLSFVLGEFFFSEDRRCYACSFVRSLMKYGGMDFNEHCYENDHQVLLNNVVLFCSCMNGLE